MGLLMAWRMERMNRMNMGCCPVEGMFTIQFAVKVLEIFRATVPSIVNEL